MFSVCCHSFLSTFLCLLLQPSSTFVHAFHSQETMFLGIKRRDGNRGMEARKEGWRQKKEGGRRKRMQDIKISKNFEILLMDK